MSLNPIIQDTFAKFEKNKLMHRYNLNGRLIQNIRLYCQYKASEP